MCIVPMRCHTSKDPSLRLGRYYEKAKRKLKKKCCHQAFSWPRIMGPAGQMPLVVCWGRARARDVVTQRLSALNGYTVHGQSLLSETQTEGETERGRSPVPRPRQRLCVSLQGVWRDDPRLVPTMVGVRTREWV